MVISVFLLCFQIAVSAVRLNVVLGGIKLSIRKRLHGRVTFQLALA